MSCFKLHNTLSLCAILLLGPLCQSQAQDDMRSHASFYMDTFGLVDPDSSPLARRAYQIFERVRRVAEDPVGVTPTLKIINSKGKPWAIALPDGYIILSRAALDICYRGVDPATGDARLAFVLGHELSHLTSNDFWHRKMYLSLSGRQTAPTLDQISSAIRSSAGVSKDGDWQKVIRDKELRADEVGFTYASLAGFQTNLIFSDKHGGTDFLEHWVSQTRTSGSNLHFSPSARSDFLRNRFAAIVSKVEYFMSGARLAHFGRYEDAGYFFEEFRNAFPAHEVLNNLGYVNLQLARKHMPTGLRYRYWLPTLMESAPPLAAPNRSMGDTIPANALRHLERSVRYLQKAVDSHSTHLNSRLNLSTAYLYLGDYHKARAVVEEARILSPSSNQVSELRALILYGQEKEIDMWPLAVSIMEKIADSGAPSALYNLARLFEERGRDEDARRTWSELLSREVEIPSGYLRVACGRLPAAERCGNHLAERTADGRLPLPLDPAIGTDINSPAARKKLQGWQHQRRQIGPMPTDLYIAPNGNSLLAIDSRLSIAAVTDHPYPTVAELVECCGRPLATEPFGDDELWSWGGWSAVTDGKNVMQIWIAASPSRSMKTESRRGGVAEAPDTPSR